MGITIPVLSLYNMYSPIPYEEPARKGYLGKGLCSGLYPKGPSTQKLGILVIVFVALHGFLASIRLLNYRVRGPLGYLR